MNEQAEAIRILLDTYEDRVAIAMANGCTRRQAEVAVAAWLNCQFPSPKKEQTK